MTLAGCGAGAAQQGSEPDTPAESPSAGVVVHEQSGTCMPLAVESLRLSQKHDFGPADSGVSLTNEELGLTITLYTYPGANHALSDAEVTAHFKDVVTTMVRRMQSRDVEFKVVEDERFPAPGKLAVLQVDANGTPFESIAMLFTRRGWLFKMRASYPLATAEQSRALVLVTLARSFDSCA
jgi:hypothetical protein